MTILKRVPLVLLLPLTPAAGATQDLRADLLALSRFIASESRVALDVSIDVFPDSIALSPSASLSASLRKAGNQTLYRLAGVSILSTDRATIVVNPRSRTVAYARRTGADQLQELTAGRIDSALSSSDSVVFKGFRAGEKTFAIYNARSRAPHVQISLDSATSMLRVIRYDLRSAEESDGGRVEIRYRWRSPADVVLADLDESRFVVRRGEELIAAPPLSGFRVRVAEP